MTPDVPINQSGQHSESKDPHRDLADPARWGPVEVKAIGLNFADVFCNLGFICGGSERRFLFLVWNMRNCKQGRFKRWTRSRRMHYGGKIRRLYNSPKYRSSLLIPLPPIGVCGSFCLLGADVNGLFTLWSTRAICRKDKRSWFIVPQVVWTQCRPHCKSDGLLYYWYSWKCRKLGYLKKKVTTRDRPIKRLKGDWSKLRCREFIWLWSVSVEIFQNRIWCPGLHRQNHCLWPSSLCCSVIAKLLRLLWFPHRPKVDPQALAHRQQGGVRLNLIWLYERVISENPTGSLGMICRNPRGHLSLSRASWTIRLFSTG